MALKIYTGPLTLGRGGGLQIAGTPVLTYTTGLAAQYKADSVSAATADGTAIASWSDSSGNSRTLAQATGSKQPLYKTAIFGSKPAIKFDGTDDWMQASSTWTVTQSMTVFFAGKRSADGYIMDGATSRVALLDGNAGKRGIYAGGAGVADDGNVVATPEVWSAVIQGATTKLYVNGTDQGALSQNPGSGSLTDLVVGAHSGKTFGFFNGHMGELLIYSGALSDANRQTVQTYLGRKYGVTIS